MRLGIPKGRLEEEVLDRLTRAGYRFEFGPRHYHAQCDDVRAFRLKARSIPQMVALGLLEAGFCGRDLIAASGYELEVACDLGLHAVRLVAAAADREVLTRRRPLTIATELPLLADRWASGRGLAHICLNTYGSTEAWVPDYADLLVDVVETGATLAAHGLVEIEEIMRSTTVLACRPGWEHSLRERLNASR